MATIDLIPAPRAGAMDLSRARQISRHDDDRQVPSIPPIPAEPKIWAEREPDEEALEEALAEVKAKANEAGSRLQFERDETLGRTVIKVIDPRTKEVVRQIPSEEMLAIAKKLRSSDASFGLLFEAEV